MKTEDDRITVEFPAGTVDKDITITIQPASGTTAPEGFRLGNTRFSITAATGIAPVINLGADIRICVEYTDDDVAAAGGEPQLLKLAYYDEIASEWVVLDTRVDTDTGIACADTNHLSEWAILASIPGASPPLWFWLIVALEVIGIIALSVVIVRRLRLKRAEEQAVINRRMNRKGQAR